MVIPEISNFYGIVIYMYVSEHNPPHFHVAYQGFKATITIKDGIVTGCLPRRALNLVFDWLMNTRMNYLKIGNAFLVKKLPKK